MSDPASYAVVVLAGGTARRMGGGDKTALELDAGRTILDHLVGSFDTSIAVVVVGSTRSLERLVHWARERPPGGGPVAGLTAGLSTLEVVAGDEVEWVVLLAGDQPFAAEGIAPLLSARTPAVDAVVGVDASGRLQPLLGAYRRSALRRVLDPPLDRPLDRPSAGRSMHSVLDRLTITPVRLPGRATIDVDDAGDLAAARAAVLSPAGLLAEGRAVSPKPGSAPAFGEQTS